MTHKGNLRPLTHPRWVHRLSAWCDRQTEVWLPIQLMVLQIGVFLYGLAVLLFILRGVFS